MNLRSCRSSGAGSRGADRVSLSDGHDRGRGSEHSRHICTIVQSSIMLGVDPQSDDLRCRARGTQDNRGVSNAQGERRRHRRRHSLRRLDTGTDLGHVDVVFRVIIISPLSRLAGGESNVFRAR